MQMKFQPDKVSMGVVINQVVLYPPPTLRLVDVKQCQDIALVSLEEDSACLNRPWW